MRLWQHFLDIGWSLLAPPCCLCGLSSNRNYNLCQYCETTLPWQTEVCHTCALPLTTEASCGQCMQHPPLHQRLLAAFSYEPPIESLIYQFKFGHRLDLGLVLAKCFHQYLLQLSNMVWPDYLIPVPLHPKRLRERGFNQAAEISKHLSKWLNIPKKLSGCQRIRYTQAQTLIAPKARYANVKGAFKASHLFEGKHVAIIDDVYTSGQTTKALTKALIDSGVKGVQIWVIARAGQGKKRKSPPLEKDVIT